ncbi:MAG: N-acetylmuramoyl-L-alanine amidase, partial [Bacteroidetes bacterium]|nr:N-acetylmuramoyl-L-alanine amidase [Bacteroidota bacterium]
SGFDLYVSRQENSLDKQSRLLGSLITKEIAQTYTVAPDLKQRKEKGIWVLDAPDINYPAVLIQCGYINNSKDLAFISNPSNQEKIAKDILRAVERFAKEAENAATGTSSFESSEPRSGGDNKKPAGNAEQIVFTAATRSATARKDTLPANIKSIDFTKDDYVIIIYKNDKAEKITRAEAEKRGITAPAPANLLIKGPESNFLVKGSEPDSVLLFVDGVEMPASEIKKINSDIIESITVLRNWDAVEKYGEKGRRSVIEIKTKARQAADSSGGGHNIIFHKVEVEASFPGGANALVKYINNTLNKNIDDLKKEGKSGTCLIQFIVDKDGSIREAEALTMKGTKLAEIVINAINNGPKWNPAMQNGIKVTSYRKQPVTFTVANS